MARPYRYRPVKVNVAGPSTAYDSISSFNAQMKEQIQGVIDNMIGWVKHMDLVTPDILYDALEPAFQASQILVPKDTGALAESGYLEVRWFGKVIVAEVGYGRGGYPPYASIVHENPDQSHREPEQWKYLQQPLEEHSDQIRNDIVNGIREASGV